MAKKSTTTPNVKVAKVIPARAIPPASADVPHPVYGDHALEGDTRADLATRPLIKRGGSQGKEQVGIARGEMSIEQVPYLIKEGRRGSADMVPGDDDADAGY